MATKVHSGWIGVDLDGTLAEYDGWKGATHIGKPIAVMVQRVKDWIAEGYEVRIFTARVFCPKSDTPDGVRWKESVDARLAIQDWCRENLGMELMITCEKDYGMIELWDDRCVQVVANTGQPVGASTRGLT